MGHSYDDRFGLEVRSLFGGSEFHYIPLNHLPAASRHQRKKQLRKSQSGLQRRSKSRKRRRRRRRAGVCASRRRRKASPRWPRSCSTLNRARTLLSCRLRSESRDELGRSESPIGPKPSIPDVAPNGKSFTVRKPSCTLTCFTSSELI